ncbi:MAG: DegV family protein [Anaerotignum sp.]|nr:DegV family protein [Anaerotignum sp.]MBR2382696.1 DegV family protein [Anaerotignum sp.]
MNAYKIIADSSCDIPISLMKANDISYVPFNVSFDQETYLEELKDITPDEFYEKINAEKLFPKTSLPSVQSYMDAMEAALKENKDVLCLCLSSKFSGSFQSAMNAANILSESYPDHVIKVIDTTCATACEGMMVLEACRMKDAGMDINAVAEKLEVLKETSRIFVTVDSLEHLQKGGRIGKASAMAGTILNIKPIIAMKDGELHPESKVRGSKKALKQIVDMAKGKIGDEKDQYRIIFVRGDKEREATAVELANELRAEGYDVAEDVWTVGITIGSHIGPTPIAVCMLKKYEFV